MHAAPPFGQRTPARRIELEREFDQRAVSGLCCGRLVSAQISKRGFERRTVERL